MEVSHFREGMKERKGRGGGGVGRRFAGGKSVISAEVRGWWVEMPEEEKKKKRWT